MYYACSKYYLRLAHPSLHFVSVFFCLSIPYHHLSFFLRILFRCRRNIIIVHLFVLSVPPGTVVVGICSIVALHWTLLSRLFLYHFFYSSDLSHKSRFINVFIPVTSPPLPVRTTYVFIGSLFFHHHHHRPSTIDHRLIDSYRSPNSTLTSSCPSPSHPPIHFITMTH